MSASIMTGFLIIIKTKLLLVIDTTWFLFFRFIFYSLKFKNLSFCVGKIEVLANELYEFELKEKS